MTQTVRPESVRNPLAEASEALGGLRARVLEPSLPTVIDDFFADDPVNLDPDGRGPIVSPIGNAELRWIDVAAEHDLVDFATDRWLGPYKRLASPPAALAETRLSLHLVAAYIISPARRRENGKIALRHTKGGIGTPFFGEDMQLRTEGDRLIVQRGEEASSVQMTSLNDLAEFIGHPPDVEWAAQFDVPEPGDLDAPLGIDGATADYLADWFGFGCSVLEGVRAEAGSTDASRVQLWPEHFDPAFEMLSGDRRASYGVSPGDGSIDEPYVYVGPWVTDGMAPNDYWNTGFRVASAERIHRRRGSARSSDGLHSRGPGHPPCRRRVD